MQGTPLPPRQRPRPCTLHFALCTRLLAARRPVTLPPNPAILYNIGAWRPRPTMVVGAQRGQYWWEALSWQRIDWVLPLTAWRLSAPGRSARPALFPWPTVAWRQILF